LPHPVKETQERTLAPPQHQSHHNCIEIATTGAVIGPKDKTVPQSTRPQTAGNLAAGRPEAPDPLGMPPQACHGDPQPHSSWHCFFAVPANS
jgi:hypothetical protein